MSLHRFYLLPFLVLILIRSSGFSEVLFQGGGVYDINYRINDSVSIDRNTPLAQTHVTLNSGGWVDKEVYCLGSSQFTLNGGHVEGYLNFWKNSTGEINGGSVKSRVYIGDESSVVINHVTIGDLTLVWNNSNAVINGGSFGFTPSIGYQQGILATENAYVTINGGLIKGLLVGFRDNAAYDMSTIKLAGSNFKMNGMDISYGQYYASDFVRDSVGGIGLLTGTLANGDSLNANVYINDGACLYLIPEPASLSLLALGATLTGRRRRK